MTARRPVLVIGGAGFVGANLAHRLLAEGTAVLVLDNLSRPGVERNLAWLRREHGALLRVQVGDVRDAAAVRAAVRQARQVFHLAAQVAVTTSLVDPVGDFEVNARGTLNVLEAARTLVRPPLVTFTSTNKVYGGLADVALAHDGRRYAPVRPTLRAHGVSERRRLDFHSPYGCSKGTADQYVLDYARSFGVPTVVFRMSCIYGPRQMGTEDQGWVAHFLLRAIEGRPITIFGDGWQVRDLLFIDDLVDAFAHLAPHEEAVAGRAFNIGGGPERAASLLEVLDVVAELDGARPATIFRDWRAGDQRYYVSDTRRFRAATGWTPRVGVHEGIARLYDWLRALVAERAAARRHAADVIPLVPVTELTREPGHRRAADAAMLAEGEARS